ncbi:MAG: ABC transporter ATP-binding protein [Lachnospiraceae bacterium]|nr:ABC transporter ATP-binding protein [Lachnospiraceae bacterium]
MTRQKGNVIRLEQIHKSFSEKQVLKGVSFSVEAGEIFGLLGPSGAGKTTLIHIMTGQMPFEGKAEILGQSCAYQEKNRYENVGIVADRCGLYDRLSCYENLKILARIKGVGQERIEEVLKQVLLWKDRNVKVGRLSKGMRQRLLIARAILHHPRLLFLDEPTSGLDPTTASAVHTLLEELRKEGMTILLTTHNMSEAQKLCRHIVLLHEGKIVESGKPDEICLRHDRAQKIHVTLTDGNRDVLGNTPQEAEVLCGYLKSGRIKALHTSEPDLDTVFRFLTGKELDV